MVLFCVYYRFKPAHVYKGVLTCPKKFLSLPIEYKYVIVDEKEKRFTWEYLHFAESHAENNRLLVISKDFMNLLEEGDFFTNVDFFNLTKLCVFHSSFLK